MADVSDSAIAQAYADVRDDKTETNWLLLDYVDDSSNTIRVAATGSDGLEGFKAALANTVAGFGYLRFMIGNDELSQRAKFLFVSYTGPNCKVLRKARVSVHVADVKRIVKDFAVQTGVDSPDELKQDEIITSLKKAMGANYDRQASAY